MYAGDEWTLTWHARYHSLTAVDKALGSSEWIVGSFASLAGGYC